MCSASVTWCLMRSDVQGTFSRLLHSYFPWLLVRWLSISIGEQSHKVTEVIASYRDNLKMRLNSVAPSNETGVNWHHVICVLLLQNDTRLDFISPFLFAGGPFKSQKGRCCSDPGKQWWWATWMVERKVFPGCSTFRNCADKAVGLDNSNSNRFPFPYFFLYSIAVRKW